MGLIQSSHHVTVSRTRNPARQCRSPASVSPTSVSVACGLWPAACGGLLEAHRGRASGPWQRQPPGQSVAVRGAWCCFSWPAQKPAGLTRPGNCPSVSQPSKGNFFHFLSSLSSAVHPVPTPYSLPAGKNAHRKEGGKFGFAESIANQRITAFRTEKAPVDISDAEGRAEEILAEAEPPPAVYLPWAVSPSL